MQVALDVVLARRQLELLEGGDQDEDEDDDDDVWKEARNKCNEPETNVSCESMSVSHTRAQCQLSSNFLIIMAIVDESTQ